MDQSILATATPQMDLGIGPPHLRERAILLGTMTLAEEIYGRIGGCGTTRPWCGGRGNRTRSAAGASSISVVLLRRSNRNGSRNLTKRNSRRWWHAQPRTHRNGLFGLGAGGDPRPLRRVFGRFPGGNGLGPSLQRAAFLSITCRTCRAVARIDHSRRPGATLAGDGVVPSLLRHGFPRRERRRLRCCRCGGGFRVRNSGAPRLEGRHCFEPCRLLLLLPSRQTPCSHDTTAPLCSRTTTGQLLEPLLLLHRRETQVETARIVSGGSALSHYVALGLFPLRRFCWGNRRRGAPVGACEGADDIF